MNPVTIPRIAWDILRCMCMLGCVVFVLFAAIPPACLFAVQVVEIRDVRVTDTAVRVNHGSNKKQMAHGLEGWQCWLEYEVKRERWVATAVVNAAAVHDWHAWAEARTVSPADTHQGRVGMVLKPAAPLLQRKSCCRCHGVTDGSPSFG